METGNIGTNNQKSFHAMLRLWYFHGNDFEDPFCCIVTRCALQTSS